MGRDSLATSCWAQPPQGPTTSAHLHAGDQASHSRILWDTHHLQTRAPARFQTVINIPLTDVGDCTLEVVSSLTPRDQL